jgi:hypothetical protein
MQVVYERDGRWYQDLVPIRHNALAAYFGNNWHGPYIALFLWEQAINFVPFVRNLPRNLKHY